MSYPSVQFVSAPDGSATVRYDFNTSDTVRTHPLGADGLDLGVPSFTGEPESVGFDYGYRRIQLTQRIEGTRAVALARLSLLARELLRSTNWLKVQWEAGVPSVYFKTYRGEPGQISLEHADTAEAWDVTVPLVAEGFAYGPRETVTTAQVVQSPADLTGPVRTAMRVVLPAIKGDAPTGLRVKVTPASGQAVGVLPSISSGWLVGCIAGETTMSDAVIDIGTGDGFTAGTNTGAGVANAAYFSGSYRQVSITANDLSAGFNFSQRLTGSLPAPPPGRYKVMLRWEAIGTGFQRNFLFAFGQQIETSPVYQFGTSTVILNDNAQGWADLGEFTFPLGINAPDDVVATTPTAPFALKIGTAENSTTTVRIDAFKLIPISGRTVRSATLLESVFPGNSVNPLASNVIGNFDGDSDSYWSVTSGNAFLPTRARLSGAFPVADPAAPQNLLLLMATDNGSAAGASTTALNAQSAVDVTYYPRYLWVGDGT